MKNIQLISTELLSPMEENPRRIDKGQFEKLVRNIENDPDFFNARPCLVHKEGKLLTIFAGNQRYRAAKSLGWKNIPCILYEDLNDEIIRRWTILDNVHHGEHDYDMLSSIYDINELIDFGFLEKELHINLGDSIDNEQPTKKKKEIECPNCQHVFIPKRKKSTGLLYEQV